MKAKVYYTKEINSDNLIKIYKSLEVNLEGKIGIKVSTGEDGSKGYLKKDLIAPLVRMLNGTIIECNTAYKGMRNTYDDHINVAKSHEFLDYADVDIMDKDGEIRLPVNKGKHLKYDLVGSHLVNYDAIVNLAHGKGHAMGGFGGVLKNQSIGIASRNGKAYIHSTGVTENPEECWSVKVNQKDFIESMAEAAYAVADYLQENNKPIVYIVVMNYLSLECDCDAHQGLPVMDDLGIVASTDPVACDQAFLDLIWASKDKGAKRLQNRIDERFGRRITEYAEELGMGSRSYELIQID